jgi:hypothetical protein
MADIEHASQENYLSTLRNNAVDFMRDHIRYGYLAAPLATIAIAGCGASVGLDNNSGSSYTETHTASNTSAPKPKVTTETVQSVITTVAKGQSLSKIAVAVLDAEGLPYSSIKQEQIENEIYKDPKNVNAFNGSPQNILAQAGLVIPIKLSQGAAYTKDLAAEMIPATSSNTPTIKPASINGVSYEASAGPSPETVKALGRSWEKGCPPPSVFKDVQITYEGFDGKPHIGQLVVNAATVPQVKKVFEYLYDKHFPINKMTPLSAPQYSGNYNKAVANDDTTAFDCSEAKLDSSTAQGEGFSIIVNPKENPYELNKIWIAADKSYINRAAVKPGMAEPNGTLNTAFADLDPGSQWGGALNDPNFGEFILANN